MEPVIWWSWASLEMTSFCTTWKYLQLLTVCILWMKSIHLRQVGHRVNSFKVYRGKGLNPVGLLTLMGEMWKCSKKLSPDVSVSDVSISSACSSCRSLSISRDWNTNTSSNMSDINLLCAVYASGSWTINLLPFSTFCLLAWGSAAGANRAKMAPRKPWSIFTAISWTRAMKYLKYTQTLTILYFNPPVTFTVTGQKYLQRL